ncbi:GNAT family N-acetyltransferase [Pseudoxanthomonas japonensis]|uniref:GNAT family N-acetyltransferase n=1 Tax=Pseudoxanthomonas japonensis TaxID=69284 RepID=UPI0037478F98
MTGAVGGPASRITSEARGTWRVLAEYPDLADDWMRLQAQSDGTPFTHWHWISTWLEQLPAHIVPRVFRIEDAEGLLALAVAVDAPERGKGRFFGRHSLRLQETGMDALDEISVEYSGLLVRRGGEVAAYAALFRALEGHWEGWRRFRITATAHGPHIASALPAGLHCYCVLSQPCCRVDLDRLRDSGKGYVDSLKRNFRHHLRQSLRAYEAHGALKVEVADSVGQALAWLDELRTLHERRWRSKGKEGSFSSDFFHAFHQALVRKGSGDGYVRLTRVSAGALVVGYLYNLHWRGTVYFYNCGLNYGALPRYDSPGSAALAACIQHCLDEGLAAFDFLAGAQPYKRRLSHEARTLEWIDVRQRGLAHDSERLVAQALGTGTFGIPLARQAPLTSSSE